MIITLCDVHCLLGLLTDGSSVYLHNLKHDYFTLFHELLCAFPRENVIISKSEVSVIWFIAWFKVPAETPRFRSVRFGSGRWRDEIRLKSHTADGGKKIKKQIKKPLNRKNCA